MLSDAEFLQWVRGHVVGPITGRDVELAGDVRFCQYVLFGMVFFNRPRTILEIGTADGSTSIALLKAAAEYGGIVHSVDPSPCDEGKALVARCGYSDNWRFHHMRSRDFFDSGECPDQLDFVFIDGDHSHIEVKNDFLQGFKRLSTRGTIVSHDWGPGSMERMWQTPESEPAAYGAPRGIAGAIQELNEPMQCFQFVHSATEQYCNEASQEGGFVVFQKTAYDKTGKPPNNRYMTFNHETMLPLWKKTYEEYHDKC